MRGGHVGGEGSLATSISFLKPREIAIRGNRLDHSVFFFFTALRSSLSFLARARFFKITSLGEILVHANSLQIGVTKIGSSPNLSNNKCRKTSKGAVFELTSRDFSVR